MRSLAIWRSSFISMTIFQGNAGLLKCFIQLLGLGEIPWKAIEQPTVFAVILFQAVQDHGDGNAVGHQLTPINIPLRLVTQIRSPGNIIPEDHARFNVRDAVFFFDDCTLSAFNRCRWVRKTVFSFFFSFD